MEDSEVYDFGGYATKYNVRCGDGRIINKEAFSEANGTKVPLVYHHIHNDITNVLGHALLENRADGIYAYCSFNNSEKAKVAKEIVQHGDVTSLSIYANRLQHRANEVVHGVIREVSLVLSGANPEAKINNVAFKHGDSFEESETDVIIHSDCKLDLDVTLVHAAMAEEMSKPKEKEKEMEKEPTVKEVYETFTDDQKLVCDVIVEAAVEKALEEIDDEDEVMEQSAFGGSMSSRNVFDETEVSTGEVLSHSEIDMMFDEMRRGSSLKQTMLAHSITNVEVLFPEARMANATPETISRQMEWVTEWLNAVRKSPFSRVKSTAINITEDEARAKGYIKGHEKADEVITALKRVTVPQTIYKKQEMDRDDVIDIVDFDVIAFINAEMRVMLNEEIARAALVGDGRSSSSPDKINSINIRPIWQDDSLYTINTVVDVPANATDAEKVDLFVDSIIKQRKKYKGSGRPDLYMGIDLLTLCRLLKDADGYRRYKTDQELADDLRVGKIVEIELLDGLKRTDGGIDYELGAIMVNPIDYTIGTDKGGEITSFDDFDIDFNKQKYLIETRMSGALTKPKSALTFEFKTATASS